MKTSSGILKATLKNFLLKTFFCSQLIIVSLSLPSLFYVGITYNKENAYDKGNAPKKHLIITNKGKRMLAEEAKEEINPTTKYPFLVEI
jgi:hypothetical protein